MGRLPNLILIGAPKCGTSALHYYLNLHPEIFMSRQKELNFFVRELNWSKGLHWYKSQFHSEAKIIGESSTTYARYPFFQGVAERMYKIIPQAKLIYMVRDPVQRILSHYNMRYARRFDDRSFEEVLKTLETSDYLGISNYYRQIAQFLAFYDRKKILILTQQELLQNRRQTLRKVFSFLEVDAVYNDLRFKRRINPRTFHRRKTRLGLYLEKLPLAQWVDELPYPLRYRALYLFYFPFSKVPPPATITPSMRSKILDWLQADLNKFYDLTGISFYEKANYRPELQS